MFNLGQRAARGVPGQNIVNRDYYAFLGGLNLVDSFLSIKPGQLLAGSNYEPYWRGGYRRVGGYERFDGRNQPHKAEIYTLMMDVSNPAAIPEVGDVITWSTFSAEVIYITEDGNITIGDPTDGSFPDDLPPVGTVIGGYGTVTEVRVGDTGVDEENVLARVAAQEQRRALIEAVPGSGPIRGVARYGSNTYAFRDSTDGTEGKIYISSLTGWQEFVLTPILRFDEGEAEPAEGDEITGATSGATATIVRLRTKQGLWGNSTAEGYFSLKDITGTFIDDEVLNVGGSPMGRVDGATFTPTLLPGGRYEFRIYTFGGSQSSPRLYGCDCKNNAFEIDEEGHYTPIETGMDPDTPTFIGAHNSMLVLTFPGGSVQNSSLNNPFDWSVVTGANEILIGGDCTGMVEEINGALLLYTRDSVKVLYGQNVLEFQLVTLNNEMGCIPYTPQRIGSTVHLDQRGVSSVAATDAFGNFVTSNLSQLIQPLIEQKKTDVFGSQISRSRNLWRLWYDDGTAIVLGYHGNEPAGFTLIDYGRPVTAVWSSQTEGNEERLFFGSDNGMVYEQDVGTNFDGDPIEAFVLMVFYHSGSPEQNKRYRKAVLEMSGFQATIAGSIDVNYGAGGSTGAAVQQIGTNAAGNFWDVGRWSEFKWSEGVGGDPSFYIEDTGFNIGLHLYHNSATEQQHVLRGINITWSPRRLKREF